MSKETLIEWTESTFNPWVGCTRVSPGCMHCYAARSTPARVNGVEYKKGAPRFRNSEAYWKQPLAWNRKAEKAGTRTRVFPSLMDWLDDEVPIGWLCDFLRLIYQTPALDWQLLTKRPGNFHRRILAALLYAEKVSPESDEVLDQPFTDFGNWLNYWLIESQIPKNVWIGTSVEDNARSKERIPALLQIPAVCRFLSCEPLLENLALDYVCFNGSDSFGSMPGIHWIIAWGESGPGCRPCNLYWIRELVTQAAKARVPIFVKQIGGNPESPWPMAGKDGAAAPVSCREYGIFHENRKLPPVIHPKGGDMAEWPEDLRVREFPTIVR